MLQQDKSAIHLSALQIQKAHIAQLASAKKQIAMARELLHIVRNTRTVNHLLLEEAHEHLFQLTVLRKVLRRDS